MPRPPSRRLRNHRQENPMTVTRYIGFDVHKKSVSYCMEKAASRLRASSLFEFRIVSECETARDNRIRPFLSMDTRFLNRRDAGKQLAARLMHYRGSPDVLVLGLPRGGVPVAYEVADGLHVALDVFVVRKL